MPKIEVKSFPEVHVVGLNYHGKVGTGDIPQLWETLDHRMDEIQGIDDDANMAFGISQMPENFSETLEFEYIAGFPVTDMNLEQPEDLARFTIPAGLYLVIVVPNLNSLQHTFDAIYNRWIPESGYELDLSSGDFNFEMYGEEFNPGDGSEKFFIYVPIKVKTA